jgi:iron complex outermembrane receptor protein
MKPPMLKMLEWKSSLVKTTGTLANGDYLPFIAPLKLISSVRYAAKFKKGVELFFEPEWQYVFSQLNPAKFETRSYDYFLISSAMGLTLPRKNGNWHFGVHGMNLTNTVYADHLSRLKDYGINNSGRNLALSIRKNF